MKNGIGVFAGALHIQKTTETGTQTVPASPEQIKAFEEALIKDLDRQRNQLLIGNGVTYYYYLGMIRNRPKHEDDALAQGYNEPLANVLKEMPDLPEGESYVFRRQSYLSIMVVDNSGKESDFALMGLSC